MQTNRIQALFFDIDGTLVSFCTHQVVPSAADAIQQLRVQGIKVFICTGRPFDRIDNLDGIDFDGYVTLNGACCLDGSGNVIFSNPIPREDIDAFVRRLDSGVRFPCALMTPDGTYMTHASRTITNLAHMMGLEPPPICDPHEVARDKEVLQVNLYVNQEQETELLQTLFTHCESSRWHPQFIDINVRGNDKSTGIDKMLAHYGIPLAATMSFGDGGNDLPMLRHTGISVAMGNASDEVRQAADYVTDAVDDHGVANALKHFGLIR